MRPIQKSSLHAPFAPARAASPSSMGGCSGVRVVTVPSSAVDTISSEVVPSVKITLSLDLFGGEVSSNAADFFATGVKGRYREGNYEDHKALAGTYRMPQLKNGKVVEEDVALRNAMNEVLRDNYVEDCQRAVDKWNRTLEKEGVADRLRLPSRRFHRHIGIYAGQAFDPDGTPISADQFGAQKDTWLPSTADRKYVDDLMVPVVEPGKIAHWLAPPSKGINQKPFDFEYVRR